MSNEMKICDCGGIMNYDSYFRAYVCNTCGKMERIKKKMTNAELADFLCKVKSDYQCLENGFPSREEYVEWEEWLEREVRT